MSQDATLSSPEAPSVFGTPTPVPVTPDTALSLDELLTQGRLVERLVRICIRGDLYAEYDATVEELARLVDPEGKVLSDGDEALADTSKAAELAARVEDLQDQMRTWMRSVRFRAMPFDDWQVFEREHRGKDNEIKDVAAYHEQIIARCAIEPRFTVEEVRKLKTNLGQPQFMTLANGAYWACTTGGLDVPKSPAFSRSPQQQASGRS